MRVFRKWVPDSRVGWMQDGTFESDHFPSDQELIKAFQKYQWDENVRSVKIGLDGRLPGWWSVKVGRRRFAISELTGVPCGDCGNESGSCRCN